MANKKETPCPKGFNWTFEGCRLKPRSNDECENCSMDENDEAEAKTMREWFRESAWIYPGDDEEFLAKLLEAYKAMEGWEETRLWQNEFEEGKYPQYLASLDPRGVGGDTVHLWRDGQTWWPMSGDFSFDTEENIELTLRKCIRDFRRK